MFGFSRKPKLQRWKHKARGTTYEEIGQATLQHSHSQPLRNGHQMIVYRGTDGRLWVRWKQEFEDGRFEKVT